MDVEIIKCKCGGVFAASKEPDEEWLRSVYIYTKLDCTTETIPAKDFKFIDCIPGCKDKQWREDLRDFFR